MESIRLMPNCSTDSSVRACVKRKRDMFDCDIKVIKVKVNGKLHTGHFLNSQYCLNIFKT